MDDLMEDNSSNSDLLDIMSDIVPHTINGLDLSLTDYNRSPVTQSHMTTQVRHRRQRVSRVHLDYSSTGSSDTDSYETPIRDMTLRMNNEITYEMDGALMDLSDDVLSHLNDVEVVPSTSGYNDSSSRSTTEVQGIPGGCSVNHGRTVILDSTNVASSSGIARRRRRSSRLSAANHEVHISSESETASGNSDDVSDTNYVVFSGTHFEPTRTSTYPSIHHNIYERPPSCSYGLGTSPFPPILPHNMG